MLFRAILFVLLLLTPQIALADCVLLLHGLARTSMSLKAMELVLEAEGFDTYNVSYESTTATVEELAQTVVPEGLAACEGKGKIHFVTHSLGGILVRAYLTQGKPREMGRVVMLGPPNKGSEIVNAFGQLSLFKWFNGPAGMQLGVGTQELPERLGPADFEVGIIAGNVSINPIFSLVIKGESDGKVSVESTRLEGMADHLVVSSTHTFIMMNPYVIAQTITFLRTGAFDKDLSITDFVIKRIDR